MDKGVIKLQKVGIWTIYFSIYYIDPKDGRTKDGKFGIVRKYESAKPENIMQAIANSIYYSVEYAKDMISVDTSIKISKIEWSTKASMIEVTKSEFYGIAEKKYSMKIKIDDYYPSEDDLEISYKSEEIFEAMDCCICCGRKEGPYSDAKLVACKGCPELICQYCNLEELGCKMCHKEDDLSFEADMTKDGKDYVSRKIATIMRDWKKTGKIGNSSPKDSKTAQRQAIAVAFSMAARKGFKGTKKAEEDLYYFDDITKKHGIISNKLLLGSLAVVLSIASIGNMMVKTAVNAKELRVEENTESGCGCGCKKKGGCN